jgi:hypothetical protein
MGFGFEFYDPNLIDEFTSFVKKDLAVHTVYQAIKGSHDDHIMAFIWMCWILHPDNILKYYDVVKTFKSSTGQVYPKLLRPYGEYLQSEIDAIRNNPIVKDFQIYKMMNNNEFLMAHENNVQNSINEMNKYIGVEPDKPELQKQPTGNKQVLSQDEMMISLRSQR